MWHARLAGRGALTVTGHDASSFLNSLATNKLATASSTYAAFLNAQGRIIATAFVNPQPNQTQQPNFILDTHIHATEILQRHLNRYKLGADVQIRNVSDQFFTLVALGNQPHEPEAGPVLLDAHGVESKMWKDPRLTCLGWRATVDSSSDFIVRDSEEAPPALYDLCTALLGVGDGPVEMPPGDAFPMESNLERLGGVSFSKGCYVGQELTARTHFRGVTRKRLTPLIQSCERQEDVSTSSCVLDRPFVVNAVAHLPAEERLLVDRLSSNKRGEIVLPSLPVASEDTVLSDKDGATIGKLRYFDKASGIGLALMRLDSKRGLPFACGSIFSAVGGTMDPVRPSWWPS